MKNRNIFLKLPSLLMGVFLIFASSCNEEESTLPLLSTVEVTSITSTTAISGGNISDNGGTTITARGVCWSTVENPTISDSKTEDGTGVGNFSSSIIDLEPNTTYYVRAYATNNIGTAYGTAMSFTTQGTLPLLSTEEVTDITVTTAISGGNISDDGGTSVTARGICWSTDENPTISDSKTEDGTGVGNFSSSITDLEPNTTYYVRAYATNDIGTAYGTAMSFTTQEGFTDTRDGKIYRTVTIDNQVWMAENLAYEPTSGNYWTYDDDNSNVETYGYLYDWETACDVCPEGWHLPSDEEWTLLTNYLGDNAGGKLKATGTLEAGTGLWNEPNTGATNETGFTALPGGYLGTSDTFIGIGGVSRWWSATEYGPLYAWNRIMGSNQNNVSRLYINKEFGFSVRCLRD